MRYDGHDTLDPYEVLGVSSTASEEEIQDAWREKVALVHPDRNPGFAEEANERMKQLNRARELLTDPLARAEWDARRQDSHEKRTAYQYAGASGSAQPLYQVACGYCLTGTVAHASAGSKVPLLCPGCGETFRALVAVECTRHPRPRRLDEFGDWCAYEFFYRGPGHPAISFEGPRGIRVESGEHFTVSWGESDEQPVWLFNVDQGQAHLLAVPYTPRPERLSVGQRVAAALVLLLLLWSGLSRLGLSAMDGFALGLILSATLVSPLIPRLIARSEALAPDGPIARLARLPWPLPGRRESSLSFTLEGAYRTSLGLAGGIAIAWGVVASPWASGAGDSSVLWFWGLAGASLVAASVGLFPRLRRGGPRFRGPIAAAPALATRTAVSFGACFFACICFGLVEGGLARASAFAVGCLVVSAGTITAARRFAMSDYGFRAMFAAAGVALLAWFVLVGRIVPPPSQPPPPRTTAPSALHSRPAAQRPTLTAGLWRTVLRAGRRGRRVTVHLRKTVDNRFAGTFALDGGCRFQLDPARQRGPRIVFAVSGSRRPCRGRSSLRLTAISRTRARVRFMRGNHRVTVELRLSRTRK